MTRDPFTAPIGEISCLAGLALCGWLAESWEKEEWMGSIRGWLESEAMCYILGG